jgi:hypothetical protein
MRNKVISTLFCMWWVIHLLDLNLNLGGFGGSTIIRPIQMENCVCVSRGVQVAGAAWRAVMRIMAGVGDLVQRIMDGQAYVRYSMAGWSRDKVTPCEVCIMHEETMSAGFLVESQNKGRQFISGLSSKPLGWFSRLGAQNRQLRFSDLCLKITAVVSWFVPQNQVGYGLSVVPQTGRDHENDVGHASRFSGLLRLEVSRTRVLQSGLKTGGGAVAGGARGTIAKVTWRSSRKQTGRYDGLHQTLLPLLYHFWCTKPYEYFSLLICCLSI